MLLMLVASDATHNAEPCPSDSITLVSNGPPLDGGFLLVCGSGEAPLNKAIVKGSTAGAGVVGVASVVGLINSLGRLSSSLWRVLHGRPVTTTIICYGMCSYFLNGVVAGTPEGECSCCLW